MYQNKAAALGLLQPLKALSLDADTLRRATAAAVTYCDAQGAASVADLVGRASRLIVHATVAGACLAPGTVLSHCLQRLVLVTLGCGPGMPLHDRASVAWSRGVHTGNS